MKHSSPLATVAVALSLPVVAAQAADAGAMNDHAMSPPPAGATLQPRTSGAGVTYWTGGLGEHSRKALEQQSSNYSLHLLTVAGGQYVARAHIVISNGSGKTLLETTTDGPMLYAQLAPGPYTITATQKGKTCEQSVSVRQGRPQELTLSWPAGH
ncbi:MAG: carboxypeptidase-like regulatory domain-containing protein [Salinisphaera sp.]|uniref:carboxypeptidase-like regulatory domain-containing protein n=1 Tax=Salinisphaera sp. TaxID=1914330 RepID=UPI003C7CD138